MTTDAPEDRRTDGADDPVGNVAEAALFDLDPPVRPYDVHLESLGAAATALDDARGAVQVAADALDEARSAARSAKERLTRAVVQGRQAGLSWAKIGEALGISQQRPINAGRDVCAISMTRATSDPAADDQSEIPFSP